MSRILFAESFIDELLFSYAKAKNIPFITRRDDLPSDDGKPVLCYLPDITTSELERLIPSFDALAVRPKTVSRQVIEKGDNLKLIIRGGAGVNSIDLETASKHNVVVENTPGLNSVATAEYTFLMLMKLYCQRQEERSQADTLNRTQTEPENYMGRQLFGKHIGLIGMGNIGKLMAERAHAFGLMVSYYNRNEKDVPYTYYNSLEALLDAQQDIISLHIPLDHSTEHLIDDAMFNRMKHGTILLNAARPQLIDPLAFHRALQSGTLASAAIDGDTNVIEPFLQADEHRQCFITHHIADATEEAHRAITAQVLKQIDLFVSEEKIVHQVN